MIESIKYTEEVTTLLGNFNDNFFGFLKGTKVTWLKAFHSYFCGLFGFLQEVLPWAPRRVYFLYFIFCEMFLLANT